jgi:hypothetical protein
MITPDPQYGGEQPVTVPVLWITDEPAEDAWPPVTVRCQRAGQEILARNVVAGKGGRDDQVSRQPDHALRRE